MYRVLLVSDVNVYHLIDHDLLFQRGVTNIVTVMRGNNERLVEYRHAETYSVNEIDEDLLSQVIEYHQITHIVCYNEVDIMLVAQLREKYKIKGIGKDVARQFIDKSVMINCVAGVMSVPGFQLISDHKVNYECLVETLGDVFFIKPVIGFGSNNTYLVRTKNDYEAFECNRTESVYLAQNYINQPVYHSECLFQKGHILYLSLRRYSVSSYDYLEKEECQFTIEVNDNEMYRALKVHIYDLMKAFRYPSGMFHLEFFVNPSTREITFMEVAIRPPGMRIDELHHKIMSISFETALVLIEVGIDVGNIEINNLHCVSGWYKYHCGVIDEVADIDIPVPHSIIKHVSVGKYYEKPKRIKAALSVLAYSDRKQEINQLTEYLINQNPVKMRIS